MSDTSINPADRRAAVGARRPFFRRRKRGYDDREEFRARDPNEPMED
jgi:hypothetical protein